MVALRPLLELVGGPFCGEQAQDVGPWAYATGAVRAIPGASPGTPGIVTLHKWGNRPAVGVTEQSRYVMRTKGGRSWYAYHDDLDLDTA